MIHILLVNEDLVVNFENKRLLWVSYRDVPTNTSMLMSVAATIVKFYVRIVCG